MEIRIQSLIDDEKCYETVRNLTTGYPHGLRDGEIPIEACIVAVADVFDALTSSRAYKPAWTDDEAFA